MLEIWVQAQPFCARVTSFISRSLRQTSSATAVTATAVIATAAIAMAVTGPPPPHQDQQRFGSDRYGGDRYCSDRYGSDRYGSDRAAAAPPDQQRPGSDRNVSDLPNRIRVEYAPPQNPDQQKVYDLVKEHRVLETLQQILSPFRFPAAGVTI